MEDFAFDSAAYDWPTYIQKVHCPSITAPVRRMDAIRRKRGNRPTTMKDLTRDKAGSTALAVFDLDGTVMSANVIEQYLWTRLPELSGIERVAEFGRVLRRVPSYVRADHRDRGTFLRAVYRRYAGADLAAFEEAVDTSLAPHILNRLSPEAVRRIREHKAAGHTTVLVTGVVRPLTRPLAPLFDTIVAADLEVDADGRCTGFLDRSATGRGVPSGVAAALRQPARDRPGGEFRLRRLPLRPADAPGGRQRGCGQPGHRADAGGEREPLVDRGVEDQAQHPTLDPARMTSPNPQMTGRWVADGPPRFRARGRRPDAPVAGARRRWFPAGAIPARQPGRLSGRSDGSLPDVREAIRAALDAPLDSEPLTQRLRPGMRLTIAFDDNTAPVPTCPVPTSAAGSSRPC